MIRRKLVCAVTGTASLLGLLIVLFVGGCGNSDKPSAPVNPPTIVWQSSGIIWDTTVVKKDHSIMFFLSNSCSWCTKLKNETLKDTAVVRVLNESFNCVAIDPAADSLVQYRDSMLTCSQFLSRFHIRGYPTAYYFDRAGDTLGSVLGYHPAADYLAILTSIRDSA